MNKLILIVMLILTSVSVSFAGSSSSKHSMKDKKDRSHSKHGMNDRKDYYQKHKDTKRSEMPIEIQTQIQSIEEEYEKQKTAVKQKYDGQKISIKDQYKQLKERIKSMNNNAIDTEQAKLMLQLGELRIQKESLKNAKSSEITMLKDKKFTDISTITKTWHQSIK